MTTSGQRIKALLKKRKMTITDLAELSGIDRSALTNIVNDEIGLGPTRAARIAKELGVPVSRVRQPPDEDAASRRDLGRRLESLAEKVEHLMKRETALTSDLAEARTRIAQLETAGKQSPGAPRRQGGTI